MLEGWNDIIFFIKMKTKKIYIINTKYTRINARMSYVWGTYGKNDLHRFYLNMKCDLWTNLQYWTKYYRTISTENSYISWMHKIDFFASFKI